MTEYYETARSAISTRMKAWAYTKWCEGYTQQQIADALHCSHRTIQRAINGKPRIRPILTYREEDNV